MIVKILALIAIISGGYCYASPYFVLISMKTAFDNRQGQEFASHIDFSVLQDSLSDQLSPLLSQRSSAHPLVGLLGHALRVEPTQKNFREHITAGGVADLVFRGNPALVERKIAELASGSLTPSTSHAVSASGLSQGSKVERVYQYEAWNRFSVAVRGGTDSEVKFILHRESLTGWKLAEIILPL